MITGDISAAPTSVRLDVVHMGQMRMIGAVGITGALTARYLGSRKVSSAAPARGVPRKMTQ